MDALVETEHARLELSACDYDIEADSFSITVVFRTVEFVASQRVVFLRQDMSSFLEKLSSGYRILRGEARISEPADDVGDPAWLLFHFESQGHVQVSGRLLHQRERRPHVTMDFEFQTDQAGLQSLFTATKDWISNVQKT